MVSLCKLMIDRKGGRAIRDRVLSKRGEGEGKKSLEGPYEVEIDLHSSGELVLLAE